MSANAACLKCAAELTELQTEIERLRQESASFRRIAEDNGAVQAAAMVEISKLRAEVATARALAFEEAARWLLQSQADLLAKSEEERRCPICERPPHPNEASRGGWCSNPFHEAGTYRARAAEHGAAAGFIRALAPLPASLVAVPRETLENAVMFLGNRHSDGHSSDCDLCRNLAALSALLKGSP